VRRFALGRIDTQAAPQTLALMLERAIARMAAACVYESRTRTLRRLPQCGFETRWMLIRSLRCGLLVAVPSMRGIGRSRLLFGDLIALYPWRCAGSCSHLAGPAGSTGGIASMGGGVSDVRGYIEQGGSRAARRRHCVHWQWAAHVRIPTPVRHKNLSRAIR
jgi:hypothetical protein